MSDISNLDQHNNMLARDDRRRSFNLGNRLWHSDSSFKSVSAKYSLLSARIIPSAGGNTEFADMRAAYDALDPEIKAEIEDLITEHSLLFSRGQLGFTDFTAEERVKFAPVRHRLVRTNPTTGRKSLFLSSHIGGIVGWPVPEAMAFVRDLAEHATQRQFVYAHTWRQHDLVMWDNRQTMHRARRYKETSEVRDMRRTTLEAVAGRGRPRKRHVPDILSMAAEDILAEATWQNISWRTGTKGKLKARFAAIRVRIADGPPQQIRDKGQQHLPGEEAWLIGEHRVSGEKKYYLANLPARTDLRTLAATIKARWICEQAHQQLKEELGLDHFEGRSWQGLHRHALMTMIAYAFLQHRRLAKARRKK